MTREEGLRRANLAADYVRTSPIVAEPFTNRPGYNSLSANIAMLKAGGKRSGSVRDRHGTPVGQTTASIEQLTESGHLPSFPDVRHRRHSVPRSSCGGTLRIATAGFGLPSRRRRDPITRRSGGRR